MSWKQAAFSKAVRLGAAVFLPYGKNQFLMQANDPAGKFRPPGGGTSRSDKTLTQTLLRELREEFNLDPTEVRKSLKFIGYSYQAPFFGSAIFELRAHGLKPGWFTASNDPDEKIELRACKLSDPRYIGPIPAKLLTEKETHGQLTKLAATIPGATPEALETPVNCQGCHQDFDYTGEPEASMGTVECPSCGAHVDQLGNVLVAAVPDEEQFEDGTPKSARFITEQECLHWAKKPAAGADHTEWEAGLKVITDKADALHAKLYGKENSVKEADDTIPNEGAKTGPSLDQGHDKMARFERPSIVMPRETESEKFASAQPVTPVSPDEPPTTGPEAIAYALGNLDLDHEEAEAHDIVKRKLVSKRPAAIQKLGYIQGFRRSGIRPQDLIIHRVPVIPPQFRPYSVTGDVFIPGDANELYRDLINVAGVHKDLEKTLGKDAVKANKLRVYDAARAVYGFGEPVSPKTKERGVSGFLQKITGTSPKFSYLSRKLLSKNMDFVSRGVIGVDPDLHLDEIGMPEDHAWKLYSPYIQRRLVRSGMPMEAAVRAIRDREPTAKKMMEAEMKERPVMYSRAPAWHKFNTIGGWPKLVKGSTIMVNPLVTTGVGGDFDGDDQNAKVFILRSKRASEKLKADEFLDLTSPVSENSVLDMFKSQIIPVYDTSANDLGIVDLEDFPRGNLLHSKMGAKGPIDFYAVQPGIKVLALDETSGCPVWASVSNFSIHPDREVEIVNTVINRQIITDDDPRAVYGIASDSADVGYGRFTPTEAQARKVAIPFVNDVDERVVCGMQALNSIKVTEDQTCVFHDLDLNWNTGFLMGAFCGDGWWDKREHPYYNKRRWAGLRSMQLADHAGHNAKVVESTLRALSQNSETFYVHKQIQLKSESPDRYGDSTRYTYNFKHSEKLVEFFSTHMRGDRDEDTAGSGNKRLPTFAFTANREFREGLFCGLIDTDGNCSNCPGADGVNQLQLSFSSTSLRLIRDVQYLGLTLGLRGTAGFAKTTTAGNTSWYLSFSALDAKRSTVLARLQCPWKREAYEQGVVNIEGPSGQRANRVPLPVSVYEVLKLRVPCPKITKAARKLKGPDFASKAEAQNLSEQLWQGAQANSISRQSVVKVIASILALDSKDVRTLVVALDTLKVCGESGKINATEVQYVRNALLAIAPHYGDKALLTDARRIYACLNRPLKTGVMPKSTAAHVSAFISTHVLPVSVLTYPLVTKWLEIVNNTTVSWTTIKSVEKTGKRETGYDLTVPGYETFTNVEGIVLSNTMSIHLPSMPDAVDDVKNKLMPSKMLFSIKDPEKVVPVTKQEMTLGLYAAQQRPSKARHHFNSEGEALAAIRAGKVRMSDDVQYPGSQ